MSSITDQNFRFRFSAASELKTVIDQLKEIDSLTQEQVTTSRNAATNVRAVRDAESAKAKAQALEDAIVARNIAAQTTIEVNAEARKQTIYAKAQADQNTLYAEAHAAKQIALAKVTAEEEIALNKAVARQLAAEAERQEAEKLSEFRANLARQEAMLRDSIEDNISLYRRQTAEFNEEQKRQTAEFRGEQTRQTMLLRDELREQRTAFEGQGNAVRDLRNLIASAFGAHEVLQFTKDVVDAKSKIDVFKAGIEQLIGSKAEANALYNDIVRLAKTTPFEIEKLTDVVFTMKGMGVETAKLLPTLEALGNMAAVVGQEKLGLIAKAFTDVQSKGKLMKQEINQFAENGVPLYDLLAKSMGKTRDEVVKMAEAHEISFKQVEKAIFDASQKGGVFETGSDWLYTVRYEPAIHIPGHRSFPAVLYISWSRFSNLAYTKALCTHQCMSSSKSGQKGRRQFCEMFHSNPSFSVSPKRLKPALLVSPAAAHFCLTTYTIKPDHLKPLYTVPAELDKSTTGAANTFY